MSAHQLAGRKATSELLINVPRLVSAYYTDRPDPEDPAHCVSFGTSGHRGSSLERSFNENHVLAICQAICELRQSRGITGPLYAGMDTHALSEPALRTALEVFAANGVNVFIQEGFGYTPTPVISHAILMYNRDRTAGLADGVVVTPSHNPPRDGGFKYNPPEGGPADLETTRRIERRANEILRHGLTAVQRVPIEHALKANTTHPHDYVTPYVRDLDSALDMGAIAGAGLKIGVDPMGGSGVAYWAPIAEMYGLDLEVVNREVDPTFSFMAVDHDGQIRMDPSSEYAMAGLLELRGDFDVAFGNDPDYDRYGIVTRSAGLMNPNHYLAVAVWYLFSIRKTSCSVPRIRSGTPISTALAARTRPGPVTVTSMGPRVTVAKRLVTSAPVSGVVNTHIPARTRAMRPAAMSRILFLLLVSSVMTSCSTPS